MKTHYTGLVGDVGGTNARFALIDAEGRVRNLHIYSAAKYASLNEIIADYLERTMGRKHPPRAAIAVAGPVLDGEIEFTNLDWQVSEGELLAQFEFEAVRLMNDFAAQALAVIHDLGLDPAKVNPMGGAIALGHPLGATGAIRSATTVHALRRKNLKYGMVTMCVGTGMGAAGIFERM